MFEEVRTPPMVRQPSPDEVQSEFIENNLQFMYGLIDSKSLREVANDQEVSKIKHFIPDGKDITLSNLSNDFNMELYSKIAGLYTRLLMMQKKHYVGFDKDGEIYMRPGIFPAIEVYYSKFIYFMLGTRAAGDDRERMLTANPQHLYSRWLMQQNKPSVSERLFGTTKT